jgi:sulfite exporter TauE/SafE
MFSAAGAGFMLGLLGGLHCIGMCGPLILAIPFQSIESKAKKTIAYFLYGSGKTIAYMTLGAIAGFIGSQAEQFSPQQRYVSIVAGLLLLLTALLPLLLKNANYKPSFITKFNSLVNNAIAKQFRNQRLHSFGVIGFLNGLLPCGLVYAAIAAALSATCVSNSVVLMLFFGIATMLSLTVFSLLFQLLPAGSRNKLRTLFPYLIILTALVLILRGLQLGIPYVSPVFDGAVGDCGHSCCGG